MNPLIDEQPAAVQIAYWCNRAEAAEAELKRRSPDGIAELEEQVRRAKSEASVCRAAEKTARELYDIALAMLLEYEREGAAVVLKRERDHWKAQWRNATRRLADGLEHHGFTPTAWRDAE